MNITEEQNDQLALVFECEDDSPPNRSNKRSESDRLTVRFDTETVQCWKYWPTSRGTDYPRPLTVLHYVERPRKTPTGGTYTSRQFTVRDRSGKLWWGTMKKDSDIVRCRPAKETND